MSRMLDEIREQPRALERTLRQELRRLSRFQRAIQNHRPRLIVLAARGTSDNAALFGRYLLEITTGIPVSLAAPSVSTLYDAAIDYHDTLVIGISQSGESTDINIILERARAHGAITAGITNESESTLARLAEHTFLVRAGKEKSVAATKTFTGQVLMFYLIACALGAKIPREDLERIPESAADALALEEAVADVADRYCFMEQAVVVGRGLNYANAFEFALKMMETCYVVAERFSSADFLHGPIAMAERNFPVFAFAPTGVTWPSIRETLQKLQSVHADILAITDAGNREIGNHASRVIRLPKRLKEVMTPIPYIIPAQLFAAHLAAHKGINPDQPRTLNKVTSNL